MQRYLIVISLSLAVCISTHGAEKPDLNLTYNHNTYRSCLAERLSYISKRPITEDRWRREVEACRYIICESVILELADFVIGLRKTENRVKPRSIAVPDYCSATPLDKHGSLPYTPEIIYQKTDADQITISDVDPRTPANGSK